MKFVELEEPHMSVTGPSRVATVHINPDNVESIEQDGLWSIVRMTSGRAIHLAVSVEDAVRLLEEG